MKLSRDSDWLAPLILGLGAMFVIGLIALLIFLINPPLRELTKNEQPLFAFSSDPVDLKVGSLKLQVPKNYIRRNRGKEVLLHALLPDMAPYQEKNWWLFEDKGPAARLVQIRFLQEKGRHSEEQRFTHFYLKKLRPGDQAQVPSGLTHYLFKPSAKRDNEDLFTGKDRQNRRLLYLCFRPSPLSVAPHCSRTFPFSANVSLTYRFKRAHLKNWRDIDGRVQDLIEKFDRLSLRTQRKKPTGG